MVSIKYTNFIELFAKYPNTIVASTGSIIFLHIENVGYDPKKEISEEVKHFNAYLIQLQKTQDLLSSDFSNKAPSNVFQDACKKLLDLELCCETSWLRICYLSEAIRLTNK